MHRSVLQQRNRYILLVIAFLLVFSLFLTSEYWYEQTLRRLAETPSLKTSFWESSSYRYESPTLPDSTTDPSEEKYDEEVKFEEDEDENDIGRRPLNDLPVLTKEDIMDGLEDEEGQNVPVSFTEDEIAADIEEGDIDRFDHKAMQPQSNWEADQEVTQPPFTELEHASSMAPEESRNSAVESIDIYDGETAPASLHASPNVVKPFPIQDEYPFVLTVGASTNHFRSLLFTMDQARSYLPDLPVVVWDYGMLAEEIALVKGMWNVKYEFFDFDAYPEWMKMSAVAKGQYSWKIIAIYETAKMYRRTLWLDGDVDIVCNFTRVRLDMDEQGWFGMSLRGSILNWTHPSMFDYLDLQPQVYEDKVIVAGGINGFDFEHPRGYALLQRWYDCAMVLDCIGPEGSSRDNHRQDQSAISLLAHDERMNVTSRSQSCFLPHAYIGRTDFSQVLKKLSNPPGEV